MRVMLDDDIDRVVAKVQRWCRVDVPVMVRGHPVWTSDQIERCRRVEIAICVWRIRAIRKTKLRLGIWQTDGGA